MRYADYVCQKDGLIVNGQVAWQAGNPLPQTLYTSIYLDKLLWPEPRHLEQAQFLRSSNSPNDKPLVHRVLRAYCIALVKACDFIHSKITSEHYYEVMDIQLFRVG